ncbi:MAG: DUF6569 family protein [Paracoccaceae bacterium]
MIIFHTDFEFVITAEPFCKGSSLKLTPIHAPAETEMNLETFAELNARGLAEAREIGSSGIVTSIEVINKSDSYLLLLDGESIIGAKQNRICQKSTIIAPLSASFIPVNCIQQGRWKYEDADEFSSGAFVATPRMRDRKEAFLKKGRSDDVQQDVWNSVSDISQIAAHWSPSSDLDEVFHGVNHETEKDYLDFIQRWPANGYYVEGVGKPYIELFYSEDLCRAHMSRSMRGLLTDSDSYRQERSFSKIDKAAELPPKDALSKLRGVNWLRDKSVGCEKALITAGDDNGRVISLNNNFVHGYFAIGTSADV